MFDFDKWQEIFSSIRRHKLRTLLTALGVFWGIFMLVLLLGAGNGMQNGVEYQFRDDATNSIWVRRGTTSMPYKGLPKGRRIQFSNKDYDFIDEQYPEAENLTGRFYLSGDQTVVYGKKKLSFPVRGVHPGHQYVENSRVYEGRFINKSDLKDIRKIAVIGKIAKKELLGEQVDAIGKEIKIGGIVYTIVGLFEDSGGDNEMRVIFIPMSTAQTVYAGTDQIHQLMFTGGDMTVPEMKQLENKIRMDLAAMHEFDPKDKRALYMFNVAEEFETFQSLFFAIRMFVWFVGIGSIIAGVIGVSNIMLIIVKDRTKEIGIRKALGATPYSIVTMILQESILITAVAGYLGMIAGIGAIALLESIESEYFRNPQVNLGVAIVATLVLVISGTLAGLMPALQAARINPVVAMKSD
ncbi:MAG: ABC transporter permease [Saprospiraceae bacterium]|nr:MAG: ABC transporter permease [Saprospiraceae bacterium]